MHEIIARLVDGSKFREFKARYGTTLVCGFARIHRLPGRHHRQQRRAVQRIGAQRRPTSSSCATSAASRCCSCRTSPASWSGAKYEAGGIAKDGAKMVHAVANTRVPKLTRRHRRLLRRRQLRHVRARLRLALSVDVAQRPHLRHGRRAGCHCAADRQAGATRAGRQAGADTPKQADEFKRPILEKYENEGNPYHSTARLWDDGVIDPADTAPGAGTGALGGAERTGGGARFGVFRM